MITLLTKRKRNITSSLWLRVKPDQDDDRPPKVRIPNVHPELKVPAVVCS